MAIRPVLRSSLGTLAVEAAVVVTVVVTAVVAFGSLLSGCQKSGPDSLAAANAAIAANQPEAALIHLKNAVEANPKNVEARLLLGQQALAAGDAAAAVIDLRRARELKAAEDDVVPALAEALLVSGQTKILIEQFSGVRLTQPKAVARLTTTLALAHTALGTLPQARRLVAEALLADPSSQRARLARARVTAAEGDKAGAMAEVEKLLAQVPGMDEGWSYKGELLERQPGQLDAAAAAYTQALAINPSQPQALTALVGFYLAKNDVPKATASLEVLRKAAPKSFYGAYYQARINARTGKNALARTQYQELLNVVSDSPVVLMASGVNELVLKAPVQAVTQLARAVNLAPGNLSARYYLAQGQLQLGRPEQATATLAPLLDNPGTPVEILVLAAQARLLQGDAPGANALFNRATQFKSTDPAIRTALALARASNGDTDAAMRELQQISETTTDVEADLRLVSAHLVRNDAAAALKAIAVLERKLPDSPAASELRGQVLLNQKDNVGARKAFEAALQLDKNYLPAVARLTELDLLQNQPDSARKRLADLQTRQPDNARVLLAMASVAARTGESAAGVLALLERATKLDPRDAQSWMALVEFNINSASQTAALSAAQAAVAAVPDNVQLLNLLARIQVRANDTGQAAATFSKLIQLAPKAPIGYLGQAMTQTSSGNLDGAAKSVQQLLTIDPNSIDAQRILAGIALKRKKPNEALEIAKNLQRQYPGESFGYALEGEIELDQGNFGPASTAFRKGLDKRAPEAVLPRLHTALLLGKKSAEADDLVVQWLKTHPKDSVFLSYLGETAFAAKDYALAQQRFEQTLAINPNLPGVLNNLAIVLLKQNKPGAVAAAERAIALTQDNPVLLDTLAEAYASDQQLPKAVAALRVAINRTADPSALRLTLAKIYIKAEDRKNAVAELEKLVDLGDKSPQYREARQLLSAQRQR